MNSAQAKRFLAKRGATFAPGKGGHLIVTLNGRRSVLPQHGGSKELGKAGESHLEFGGDIGWVLRFG
jgi:mRNA interferase HicA